MNHPILDDGAVAQRVCAIVPDGVDLALELVGTPTLPDTLAATRVHGVVCFTGMLSNQWTVPDFYPIDYLPRGVRLTAYGGDASDLPTDVLQGFLDDVAAAAPSSPWPAPSTSTASSRPTPSWNTAPPPASSSSSPDQPTASEPVRRAHAQE